MRLGFIFMLFLGIVGCSKNTESSSNQAAPSPAPAAATPAASTTSPGPAEKPQGWERREESAPLDGTKKVTLALRSTNILHYSGGGEGPARIELSCEDHLFLYMRPGTYTTGLRYKFDGGAPEQDNWGTDGQVMTTIIDTERLNQMMRAKTLKVEFTPPLSDKQVASFDLGNLKELIQREKGCDFRKKARF